MYFTPHVVLVRVHAIDASFCGYLLTNQTQKLTMEECGIAIFLQSMHGCPPEMKWRAVLLLYSVLFLSLQTMDHHGLALSTHDSGCRFSGCDLNSHFCTTKHATQAVDACAFPQITTEVGMRRCCSNNNISSIVPKSRSRATTGV